MKIFLVSAFVLLITSLFAQTDYKQNLVDLAVISFPGMPEYHTNQGPNNVTNHHYKVDNNTNIWKVQVKNFNDSKILKLRPQDLSEFYLTGITSTTRQLKAALIKNKEVESNGLKAIEFEYYYTDDQDRMIQTLQRIIYFNNFVITMDYSTYINSYNGHSITSDAKSEKFFNSFTVAADKPAVRQYNLEASAPKFKPKSGVGVGLLIVLAVPFALGAWIF